jgi:hypothetical protein
MVGGCLWCVELEQRESGEREGGRQRGREISERERELRATTSAHLERTFQLATDMAQPFLNGGSLAPTTRLHLPRRQRKLQQPAWCVYLMSPFRPEPTNTSVFQCRVIACGLVGARHGRGCGEGETEANAPSCIGLSGGLV